MKKTSSAGDRYSKEGKEIDESQFNMKYGQYKNTELEEYDARTSGDDCNIVPYIAPEEAGRLEEFDKYCGMGPDLKEKSPDSNKGEEKIKALEKKNIHLPIIKKHYQ